MSVIRLSASGVDLPLHQLGLLWGVGSVSLILALLAAGKPTNLLPARKLYAAVAGVGIVVMACTGSPTAMLITLVGIWIQFRRRFNAITTAAAPGTEEDPDPVDYPVDADQGFARFAGIWRRRPANP